VLILHRVIPCILICALLAASLIHLQLNWPTCTLLVLYSYSTRAALPSVSVINAGIRHARDVTEVTWSLPTVVRPSVTAQPSNARQREARGMEGRQDAAALRCCCAIAFLVVSDFYQLPHGAITPHCSLLKAVRPEQLNSISPLFLRAVLATFLSCGLVPVFFIYRGYHSCVATSTARFHREHCFCCCVLTHCCTAQMCLHHSCVAKSAARFHREHCSVV
jgi:hypothetical protein